MAGDMDSMQLFDLKRISHIGGVDHPESLGVGPRGEVYTTGTGCQVYRVDVTTKRAEQFAKTKGRCLGTAVDASGNLYAAHTIGEVLKITPPGEISDYSSSPANGKFMCPNYPAFDRQGNLYLSDSGDWSATINGKIHKIPPGGGPAQQWFPEPVNTPNAIALDADESHLYYVETFGPAICRIEINSDGTAGRHERILHKPDWVPDGIAIDTQDRIWIACHRPDAIFVFDLRSRKLELFAHDWRGEALRGPTDVAFAGPNRDMLLAASLDAMQIHCFGDVGARGIALNHPQIE
jgi:gluconolactonase